MAVAVAVAVADALGGHSKVLPTLLVQVMETRKKKLGADHPDTLTSMANLALTYRNQGRWDAAEELEVQVMETFKKKLGADHPDTLSSISNQYGWKLAPYVDSISSMDFHGIVYLAKVVYTLLALSTVSKQSI
ncbi:hypothetical protein BU23DRAFT_479214 [Bimuria novae-zelandiae CBS 107.79]|uniref:Kinesin light chain n=1 Tax=Bimuria novae-zelandiae CBS 107.79 TaxID=1447943 RepID=A0A6A5UVQ3_9PLEO|nr:hypothetical protein BU23DRAFT_479214 [Bimuria novae-zelandiae CBS 107.79]